MDPTILLSLALGAFIIVYFLKERRKQSRFTKLVDEIPGPRTVPLLGNANDLILIPRSGLFKIFDERAKTFWPIFRIWNGSIPEVHLSLPEHIEAVLSSTTHLEKSTFYNFVHPWLGTGLLTSSGGKWHSHRKMITPTFHFKILDTFVDVFVEKSEILVQKLKMNVNGPGFDIYPFITRCALDIICETAMGTTIKAQEETDSEYVSAVYEMSELTLQRILKPWLHSDFIFNISPLGRKYKKDLRILHGFTNKIIQERKEARRKHPASDKTESSDDSVFGKKKRMAFLDLLLESSEKGNLLTDEELREEVDTFMFEGHDTTSAGISWVLYLLGSHQDIQDKVFEELDGLFQDTQQAPTMHDLQNMKYLEMVIKESLRIFPSVPFIGRVAKEDIQLGQYIIPAGCMISVHIYHVHRNPKYYPDPETFNPDNFLPERVQGRHPYAYIPFSAGPRNCIGQKFALLEEKVVISTIIRNYRVRSLDKREDLTLMSELILRPQDGIRVTLKPRNPSQVM
ncbi:cytochrome P450 4C1 isoform X2 [Anabrus simplex]